MAPIRRLVSVRGCGHGRHGRGVGRVRVVRVMVETLSESDVRRQGRRVPFRGGTRPRLPSQSPRRHRGVTGLPYVRVIVEVLAPIRTVFRHARLRRLWRPVGVAPECGVRCRQGPGIGRPSGHRGRGRLRSRRGRESPRTPRRPGPIPRARPHGTPRLPSVESPRAGAAFTTTYRSCPVSMLVSAR